MLRHWPIELTRAFDLASIRAGILYKSFIKCYCPLIDMALTPEILYETLDVVPCEIIDSYAFKIYITLGRLLQSK